MSTEAPNVVRSISLNLNQLRLVAKSLSKTKDAETKKLTRLAPASKIHADVKADFLALDEVCAEIDIAISHSSSLGRELEFVISHTIHHHALIKERLQHLGIEFDETFGVAPSTLEYRNGLKQ